MKLKPEQRGALNSLSQALMTLSQECLNDDEFNDLIAEFGWFNMSVDEINSEVQNVL